MLFASPLRVGGSVGVARKQPRPRRREGHVVSGGRAGRCSNPRSLSSLPDYGPKGPSPGPSLPPGPGFCCDQPGGSQGAPCPGLGRFQGCPGRPSSALTGSAPITRLAISRTTSRTMNLRICFTSFPLQSVLRFQPSELSSPIATSLVRLLLSPDRRGFEHCTVRRAADRLIVMPHLPAIMTSSILPRHSNRARLWGYRPPRLPPPPQREGDPPGCGGH